MVHAELLSVTQEPMGLLKIAALIHNELRVVCPEVFKYCKVPCANCKEEGCYFA